MNSLRSIYYWFLGGLYFAGLMLAILFRSIYDSPVRMDPWIKRHLRRLFKLIGADLIIEYQEELPVDQPLIFMANHSSLIDIPLLQVGIPRQFTGILANHQFSFFLYGRVVKRLGHIAIDRNNPRQSLRLFQQAKDILKAGTCIVVLPEGGRSMNGQLMPFKKLPFRFAIESGVKIVPLAVSGVFEMKPKGSWHLKPGALVLRFGAIIATDDLDARDAQDLSEQVKREIHAGLEPFERGEA